MNRRKFLGALGIGTAAAPLAAKVAMEKETLSLMTGQHLAGGNINVQGAVASHDIRALMSDHVTMFGFPKHVLDQCWEEAKWVSALDFDIANKRSWSLAAKIHEQRQRNFEKKLDFLKSGGRIEKMRRAFFETFGFNFLTW